MTASEVLDNYLTLLYTQFEHDVDVMSRPWLYWCVLPIIVYVAFFTVKWWCLLVPLTLPLTLLALGRAPAPPTGVSGSSSVFLRN